MMRQLFFLRQTWISTTILAGWVGFFMLEGPWDWLSLFAAGVWLFLHRRRTLDWQETFRNGSEMFLAPYSGEIVKIAPYVDPETQKNYTEIRVASSHYRGWGLYLPISGELSQITTKEGDRFPRAELGTLSLDEINRMERTDMTLNSFHNHQVMMRFPPVSYTHLTLPTKRIV